MVAVQELGLVLPDQSSSRVSVVDTVFLPLTDVYPGSSTSVAAQDAVTQSTLQAGDRSDFYNAIRRKIPEYPYAHFIDPQEYFDRYSKQNELIQTGLTAMMAYHPSLAIDALEVGALACALGMRLGLRGSPLNDLLDAAVNHDYGKINIDKEHVLGSQVYDPAQVVDIFGEHPKDSADFIRPYNPRAAWIALNHHQMQNNRYPLYLNRPSPNDPYFKAILALGVADSTLALRHGVIVQVTDDGNQEVIDEPESVVTYGYRMYKPTYSREETLRRLLIDRSGKPHQYFPKWLASAAIEDCDMLRVNRLSQGAKTYSPEGVIYAQPPRRNLPTNYFDSSVR